MMAVHILYQQQMELLVEVDMEDMQIHQRDCLMGNVYSKRCKMEVAN